MKLRAMLVGLIAAGLMSSCAAASPPEAEPTLQYGTITGKGYEPPTREVRCDGNGRTPGSCKWVEVPECWRLDLRMWWVLPVSACVPEHRWEQVQAGDYWGGK